MTLRVNVFDSVTVRDLFAAAKQKLRQVVEFCDRYIITPALAFFARLSWPQAPPVTKTSLKRKRKEARK